MKKFLPVVLLFSCLSKIAASDTDSDRELMEKVRALTAGAVRFKQVDSVAGERVRSQTPPPAYVSGQPTTTEPRGTLVNSPVTVNMQQPRWNVAAGSAPVVCCSCTDVHCSCTCNDQSLWSCLLDCLGCSDKHPLGEYSLQELLNLAVQKAAMENHTPEELEEMFDRVDPHGRIHNQTKDV